MYRRSCFWRCASRLATVVLLVLFRGSWSHPRNPRWSLAGGALAGVFLFSGYAFQTIGLQFTTAPKSAFLTGLTAVMTPLLAALVYRKKPRAVEIGGVLLATCGMALMTLPGATLAMNRGDLLTVCCAACYAAHILTLSRYSATSQLRIVVHGPDRGFGAVAWSLFRGMETPTSAGPRECGRPSSSPVFSPLRWPLPSRPGRNATPPPPAPR
jgi:drug/metabolite transporter (DMT)-like permease